MHLRKLKTKEQQMLTNLSVEQVEQALQWLDSPVQSAPPQELEQLSQVEWYLLDQMLQNLILEKRFSSLH